MALSRQVWLTIQVLVVALLWLQAVGGAEAGHTIADGSCWKSGEPRQCRNTWVQDADLYIRLIDEFSTYRSAWLSQATTAALNWTGNAGIVPGPQRVAFDHPSIDNDDESWVYLKYAKCKAPSIVNCNPDANYIQAALAGEFEEDPDLMALTFNCDFTGPGGTGLCDHHNVAKVVVWSEIFFVEDNMVIHNGTTYRVNTFAHEYGHALGLRHHDSNNTLMKSGAPLSPIPTAPGSFEFGSTSCLNGRGVRCVYHWSGD